jgi:hypothetical protein
MLGMFEISFFYKAILMLRCWRTFALKKNTRSNPDDKISNELCTMLHHLVLISRLDQEVNLASRVVSF